MHRGGHDEPFTVPGHDQNGPALIVLYRRLEALSWNEVAVALRGGGADQAGAVPLRGIYTLSAHLALVFQGERQPIKVMLRDQGTEHRQHPPIHDKAFDIRFHPLQTGKDLGIIRVGKAGGNHHHLVLGQKWASQDVWRQELVAGPYILEELLEEQSPLANERDIWHMPLS